MSSPPGPQKGTDLKFKPKTNVQRRTQAERQALAREEAKREQVRQRRAAEDAQIDKQAHDQRYGLNRHAGQRGRGRGSRGSGRGGFMGDSSRPQTAQSPRDAGPPAATEAARGGASASSSTGKTARTKTERKPVKVETDGDVAMADAAPPETEKPDVYVLSDDDDDEEYGKPRDIDLINISSDDGEAYDEDGQPVELITRYNMPVRMERHEHVDRQIGINTESSAATAAGSRKGGAAVTISSDDEDDSDAPGVKRRHSKGKGRRPSVKQDADAMDITEPPDARHRRKSSQRGRKPEFQTDEERVEWEIQERDLHSILEELTQCLEAKHLAEQNDDNEQRERASREATRKEARRDSNIFLFQLPPVMPNLLPTGTFIKSEKDDGKEDKEKEGRTETKKASNIKNEEEEIKLEEGADAATAAEDMLAGEQDDERRLKVSPGFMGKLRVRKSGKTTLDWGGTAMNVNAGMSAQFLQTAVLAQMSEHNDDRTTGGRRWEGEACSMGQIRGKFVLTPDWTEMLR